MPKIKIYNTEGKEVGEKELRAEIFGVRVNPTLVHEVTVSLLANERKPYAHTKTRGDVRGGGRKPWKQKGTGRARHGSRRSPIWVGGGITFGPRSERDYSVKVNRKTKQLAMFMTLSDKVTEQKMILVESFGVKDGKTKEFASLVKQLPVKAKTFVVVAPGAASLLRRSTNNLPGVTLRNVGDLGLLDLLRSECVVLTPEAVDKIEQKFMAAKA
jgi:large subunit ribosomal protein L4